MTSPVSYVSVIMVKSLTTDADILIFTPVIQRSVFFSQTILFSKLTRETYQLDCTVAFGINNLFCHGRPLRNCCKYEIGKPTKTKKHQPNRWTDRRTETETGRQACRQGFTWSGSLAVTQTNR